MLIPRGNQWQWNDGPLCDTQEEALETAKQTAVVDGNAEVVIVDGFTETLEVEDE